MKAAIQFRVLKIAFVMLAAVPLFAADIRGKITNITPANTAKPAKMLGSILIEGALEKDTNVDKAFTRITARTRIFKMQDCKKVMATFNDLKVGQTVEATFVGPVAESYPVQGTGGEIIIQTRAPLRDKLTRPQNPSSKNSKASR